MLCFVIKIKNIYFVSKCWPQHRGTEFIVGVSGYFWNYDVPYGEECDPKWTVQCLAPNHINSNRFIDREKNQYYMEKEEKAKTQTCMYREYGLVCLKEMYFYDERRRCYRILLTKDSVVRSEHFTRI